MSPYNPDKVYALGFTSQVSTDGGKTWKNMDKPNVHADHHALWVNPNKDAHLINGNDGGVNSQARGARAGWSLSQARCSFIAMKAETKHMAQTTSRA